MESNPLGFAIAVGLGVLLVASGVLAYTGHYKGWLMLKSFLPGWPGLAGGYIGVMILLAVFLPLVGDAMPPLLFLVFAAVLFVSMLIGIIGMFWMPRFLLPQWVKETQDEMRRGEDTFSQAMRPGGALYGRLGVPRDEAPPRLDAQSRADGGDAGGIDGSDSEGPGR
ncbi:hypothetical protein [Citricoccus sp. GCM10030269]|uniref:hypothetical protein n=1 Tax=Citricoccus sp. GCM10030269 TaxID=3273388 RepID=UPI00360E2216